MNEFMSYLYGLLQTDGNLYETSRNRGRISLELKKEDEVLLEEINNQLKINSYITERTKNTNFSKNYTSVCLKIYDLDFRKNIKSFGFPVGKKSEIIEPPKTKFVEPDYIRGLIDGDGSLGLTGNGFPFLSFTIKSEKLKEYYLDYIFRKTGKRKNINRNKRDNIYNICVYKEDAQVIIKEIYYENCLCLNRKMKKMKEVLSWKRPKSMKKRS